MEKQRFEKKYKATIKSVKDDGTVVALIGPSSIDRDMEVIEPGAWEKTMPAFMAHPVLLSSHSWDKLTDQIGEVTGYKVTPEGNEVTLKYYHGQGNAEADWAYFLAKQGIAAFSHGFYGTKWTDGDGKDGGARRTFHEIELLEISQVLVPANRDALQRSLEKSLAPGGNTDTKSANSVTITIDACNAEAFAEYLKSKTATVKAAASGDAPTLYDTILDGQDAGTSQAPNANDDDALKELAAGAAQLKAKLKEI